jgi:Sulfotransferase family
VFSIIPVRNPIFIVGAARSGTTILAEILAHHPEVAYWVEPKYIWRYRDAGARSDVRPPEAATPKVKSYIRRKFEDFLEKSGKSRFMEKTPSNCFRMAFMREVFPEAKFVVIYRDGRDVTLSAAKKWTSKPDPTALRRRLRSMEIPGRDLPFYAFDFVRDVIARQWHAKGGYVWGPLFSGIKEVRAEHTVEETCAIQWRESVKAIKGDLMHFPEDAYITIHYEKFIQNPSEVIGDVLYFCGLQNELGVLEEAEDRVSDYLRTPRTPEEDSELMQRVQSLIFNELNDLGYVANNLTT